MEYKALIKTLSEDIKELKRLGSEDIIYVSSPFIKTIMIRNSELMNRAIEFAINDLTLQKMNIELELMKHA